jgi:PhzF family phenazine biosynthesis protein
VSRPVTHEGSLGQAFGTARVWLYASFAGGLDGGNPAGVVLSSEPIPTRTAQSLANVLSVPTTGFVVLDRNVAASSARVRFFTPQREIDACGHVTIAIATALVEVGIWRWGDDAVVRARGGEFPLRLRNGWVEMSQRRQALEPVDLDWGDVRGALGPIRSSAELPLAVAGTGLRHLIVPLADVAALDEIVLAAERIAELAERCAVDTICVWAPSGQNHVRMRDLCAGIGALEEPASGTTAGALALYLAEHDQVRGAKLAVDQGIEMGRPSRIEVVITAPDAITVRGQAQRVLAGTLELAARDRLSRDDG